MQAILLWRTFDTVLGHDLFVTLKLGSQLIEFENSQLIAWHGGNCLFNCEAMQNCERVYFFNNVTVKKLWIRILLTLIFIKPNHFLHDEMNFRFLVLDEADRLLDRLDGDFGDDLEVVFSSLPTKRQTLLFSATLTDTLQELQDTNSKKPFTWSEPKT